MTEPRNNKPSSTTRQKACSACTKAKRRCDLRHPACRRCVVKGIECHYVSTRLHDSSTSGSSPGSASTSSGSSSGSNINPKRQKQKLQKSFSTAIEVRKSYDGYLPPGGVQQQQQQQQQQQHDNNEVDDILLSILSSEAEEEKNNNNLLSAAAMMSSTAAYPLSYYPNINKTYEYQFFLTPTSWHVTDADRRSAPRPSWKMPHLNDSVQQVLRWVKQWFDEGSNAFIHKHLYGPDGSRMPKCMQDAYTACAAYFGCTERNRSMVLRIIEDRVQMLLDEEDESLSWGLSTARKGVVAEHLARVQALLAYQVLRLLSGDARQRTMAEELFPTLRGWSMQMLECALLSSQYVQQQQLISSSSDSMMAVAEAPAAQKRESEWQAWILAESVRRTWLVAGHTQCIYGLLRDGISTCPGGLMFTTREGLWQANSAEEWWEKCWQKDVLFCHSLETNTQLIKKARPEEVDDFGMFVLRILSEKEEVERVWLDSPESV